MVTFEFIPFDALSNEYMDFPDSGYLNEKFDRLDYGSFYSIMILGVLFIVMVWMLILYIVYLIFSMCKLRYHWPHNILASLSEQLFFKQWVVFSYINFLEIIIVLFLQAKLIEDDWFETKWVFLSFIIWIFLALLVFFLCFTIFIVVCRKITIKS